MNDERLLALDISTKTGWASVVSTESGMKLEDYATLEQIHCPDIEKYPSNYVIWAHECFSEIQRLITTFKPDVLIIEETSKGSKNAMSQKILEWTHFLLARYIRENQLRSVYIMTEEWRRELGCKMNDQEKARNKEVRTYKKDFQKKNGKKTTIAYDINGKRIGLIGKKHVNIRRINEIFGKQLFKGELKRKDEDHADGLGLAACYHNRRFKKDNKEEVSMDDIVRGNV